MFVLRGLVGRALLAVAGACLVYLLAAVCLDPRAELSARSPRPSPAAVSAYLRARGLDDRVPPLRRCAVWAAGLARGDLGATLDGTPVRRELLRRSAVSLRLVIAGAVPGFAGGVVLGALGAARRHGAADRLLTAGALVTLSVPVFALAVVLQAGAQLVNARTGVRVFEWTGEYTPGEAGGFAGRLRHLMLPAATIALGQAALCARYQRGVMLDVLDAAYVRTALGKGLRRRQALTRHALRVAVVPMTTFAAYGFAGLLTGVAVTEKVFGWHGAGEWLIDSIARNDVNAVAACGCVTAAAVGAAGVLSDLARAALDPRVRA
jgi:ABC-type dipeptide/oligopeptide/nickel transport system permease component